MAGTLAITDFSHVLMVYPDVAGTSQLVSMRNVYGSASTVPGGLVKYTGTPAIAGKRSAKSSAHVYIHAVDDHGVVHKRKIPCDPAFPKAPNDISGLTIDGLKPWVYGGYRGEKNRGTLAG